MNKISVDQLENILFFLKISACESVWIYNEYFIYFNTAFSKNAILFVRKINMIINAFQRVLFVAFGKGRNFSGKCEVAHELQNIGKYGV